MTVRYYIQVEVDQDEQFAEKHAAIQQFVGDLKGKLFLLDEQVRAIYSVEGKVRDVEWPGEEPFSSPVRGPKE
jgi:hypothetical protein